MSTAWSVTISHLCEKAIRSYSCKQSPFPKRNCQERVMHDLYRNKHLTDIPGSYTIISSLGNNDSGVRCRRQ